MELFNLYTCW